MQMWRVAVGDFDIQYRSAKHLVNRIGRKSAMAPGLVVTSLALLTGLLAGSGPVRAEGAIISLAPAALVLGVDGTGFVDVMVGDLTSAGGLGAYSLAISFDDSVVEVTGVEDGDDPFSGGEPTEANPDGGGPFWKIDNDTSEVRFAAFQATQLIGPGGNFRIARINLQAVGALGTTSPITIVTTDLIDAKSGESVAVTPINGSVLIDNPDGVSGKTTLQFRSVTGPGGRASVGISCLSFADSLETEDDGMWQFTGVPEETCTLTATAPGYLNAEGSVTVGSTGVIMPANELLAGDADHNDFININDITGIIAKFGQIAAGCEIEGRVVDLDCNDIVNINDITGAISNFGKGTQPFPTSQ